MAEAARTKEDVLKDFRTQEILEAARRVVALQGWADASMERIAQEAGVAKGTLYLYFDGKDELLDRTLAYGLDRLMASARAAVGARAEPVARLRAAVRAGLDHARENRAFFQAVIDARHTPHSGRDAGDGGLHVYADLLSEVLEEGARAGALRPVDATRAARLLVHGMSGLVAESLLRGTPFPTDGDAEAMLDVFLHGLAADRGDLR